ncbi:MAG: 16S rRNA processing protein RimM [Candidatus Eremiobacteraeota bacterium]|nr:16S rRNA processing protein RimM [Candidatus Eremiobacteraeota bacterium]
MDRGRDSSGLAELHWGDLVAIGKCLKPHGIRGELKVAILTDFPERFEETESVYLHNNQDPVHEVEVEAARFHHGSILLKLAGVDTIEQAERWRNYILAVPEDELIELEEDEYWHFELEGLEARKPDGQVIGKVSQVLNTPGHDLYVVQGPGGEVLIPAVSEYVGEINLEEGFMVVTPPEF